MLTLFNAQKKAVLFLYFFTFSQKRQKDEKKCQVVKMLRFFDFVTDKIALYYIKKEYLL